MNAFEAKREARIERLRARADRLRELAQGIGARASRMAEAIPLGQPILVGHHSEKRDRNYRARIQRAFEKSAAMLEQAQDAAHRASAAERNAAIFSDDPDAGEKLEAKIARLEARQAAMIRINKVARKLKLTKDEKSAEVLKAAVAGGTLTDPEARALIDASRYNWRDDLCFPSYSLTNNNANIRRLKARLVDVEQREKVREALGGRHPEAVVGGVRIVLNHEVNRVQIVFPSKPSKECRAELRLNGFRWAPSENAWQRHISAGAEAMAAFVVQRFYGSTAPGSSEVGPSGS